MAETTATCLCGSVELRIALPPKWVGHCHCVNCRRAQGAGVWTYATFTPDAVRVARGAGELTRYQSDTQATRQFCRRCGSTLTYESPRWPNTIDVSVGCVDGDLGVAPSKHMYADRSPQWCPILDDLPRYGGSHSEQRMDG